MFPHSRFALRNPLVFYAAVYELVGLAVGVVWF
jgi:hypothetical protein